MEVTNPSRLQAITVAVRVGGRKGRCRGVARPASSPVANSRGVDGTTGHRSRSADLGDPGVAVLAAAGVLIVVHFTLRLLLVRRRARQDDTGDRLTVTLPDGSTRAYPKLARLDPDTGGPAAGWMRFYEAVRLAEEYALPIKEMTTRETTTLLVEEFVEQHREHFDERNGFVERVPLTRWLLSLAGSHPPR